MSPQRLPHQLQPAVACFNVQDLQHQWHHISVRPRKLKSLCSPDAAKNPNNLCPYDADAANAANDDDEDLTNNDVAAVTPIDCDIWLFRYLLKEVLSRPECRHRFIRSARCGSNAGQIWLRLHPPAKELIDYEWNYLNEITSYTDMELDHLTSWLSTLGGGYSALGDSMDNCANIAARISIYQFRLALQFGDPSLVARSKLYMAIALIQKRRLRCAKHLTRLVYHEALAARDRDDRLLNMCHGIWLKLQWSYSQRGQPPQGAGGAAAARRGAA